MKLIGEVIGFFILLNGVIYAAEHDYATRAMRHTAPWRGTHLRLVHSR